MKGEILQRKNPQMEESIPNNNHQSKESELNLNPRPTLYYGRILLGEIIPLLAAMKRTTTRWSSNQQDNEQEPLVQQLRQLQIEITHMKTDSHLEPNLFLDPFLAIIRSEDTTGPVTKSALAAVNRMLNYGLIDSQHTNSVTAVESVAAAVTHARFIGTDQGADEVVLWEILTVLRTLILGPVGHLLTNESVCEILNSSFRICFETRLSELLRNCTEDALRHMVQLLFARLPQFKDDPQGSQNRKLKMRAGTVNEGKGKRGKGKFLKASPPPSPAGSSNETPPHEPELPVLASPSDEASVPLSSEASEPSENDPLMESPQVLSDNNVTDSTSVDSGITDALLQSSAEPLDISHTHLAPENQDQSPLVETVGEIREGIRAHTSGELGENSKEESEDTPMDGRRESLSLAEAKEDFINLQGVKFTQEGMIQEGNALSPYGLPCVREVFRFLISLTSPNSEQNTSNMVLTALNLLTVALEVGVEHINHIPPLLELIKNQLCRNLFMLIKVDPKPKIFMASLRVCTLLFESLRVHLKFQLEMFINKLTSLITSESPTVLYSYKELALETIVQLWRIPGLITELFLNFDCNLYSSNVFEDLTKVLSKNAFPVQGLYSTNLLSLEALLTVIEIIDSQCPPVSKKKVRNGMNQQDDETLNRTSASIPPSVVAPFFSGYLLGLGLLGGYTPVTPLLKARPIIIGHKEVLRQSLLVIKEKKRLLVLGTDQFNVKPDKGIQFLQDNGIIGMTNDDIAVFVKENPHLDKRVIGEYVSKKKNVSILSAFVRSFDFGGLRIDECLRTFLETFRLPGEAPLIGIIIEHFSSHWHASNGKPFDKDDAAFTLAYAVIMLNVDQHNQNAKKQNVPMTLDQFRNNLRGVNNGNDFDPKMLEEIYCAIHNEEIVMPAEQTGLVKENYLWKMLLKRGNSKEGEYLLTTKNNNFDKDLFALSWGPTIASLSYVFDKSCEDSFVHKALSGFKKCASIAARYGMSDVFDNLVVSLCKFTTLNASVNDFPEHVAISFGSNRKAQLAARTVFRLVISHGDILRDGWKNILELLLQLFRCRLLSSSLIESEDFVEPSGKVSLVRDLPTNTPRVESSLFSSLYSYIALGDVASTRGTSPEDVELIEKAKMCIRECHPERLITESAFLRYDSLNELLKAMMGAGDANNMVELAVSPTLKSRDVGNSRDVTCGLDEYSQAFLLELVVSVLVANKDRAGGVWPSIRDHIYSLLMGAAAADRHFLLERCIVAVLRVAKVLLRRPELANPILQSLRMLLLLRPHVLNEAALQVVSGIHEVLSVNADHIHDPNDWAILFALLECSGAGAKPPPIVNPDAHDDPSEEAPETDASPSSADSGHCTEPCGGGASDGDASVTCSPGSPQDDGVSKLPRRPTSLPSLPPESDASAGRPSRGPSPETIQNPGGWILVGREGEIEPVPVRAISVNEWDIVYQRALGDHKPEALLRAVDTLAFLVREHHITAASLPSVVQACRTFVEATLNGVKLERKANLKDAVKSPSRKKSVAVRKKEDRSSSNKRPKSPTAAGNNAYDADESDSDEIPISYQQVSEKLLDLMDTLHTSSGQILNLRSEEESEGQDLPWNSSISLWQQALCPLLQGIARYCCDTRHSIRNLAMTYLQRALLNHDLQTLTSLEWESCFNKVLFPLLAKLLQPLGGKTNGTLEETRVRAATLVQKVYLRHLTPLLCLPTFTALWLTILDFMDKYLNTHKSDHLSDAIPEILKNMLLVMETTQVFHTSEGFTHLWSITWDRIDAFLPHLRHDLFKSHPPSEIHRIEVVASDSGDGLALKDTTASPEMADAGLGSGAVLSSDAEEKASLSTPRRDLSPESRDRPPEHFQSSSNPEDEFVPHSLREQNAVRLSLSQEDIPNSIGSSFILQPPLPHLYPISPAEASPSNDSVPAKENFSTQPLTLLHQDLSYNVSYTLPRFAPASSLNHFPTILLPHYTLPDPNLTDSVSHTTTPDPVQTQPLSSQSSSEHHSSFVPLNHSVSHSPFHSVGSPSSPINHYAPTGRTINLENSPTPTLPPASGFVPPLSHSCSPTTQSSSEFAVRVEPLVESPVDSSVPVVESSPRSYFDNQTADDFEPATDPRYQASSSPPLKPASLLFSQASQDDFPINSTLSPLSHCVKSQESTTSTYQTDTTKGLTSEVSDEVV